MMMRRAGTLLLVLFVTVIHARHVMAQVSDVVFPGTLAVWETPACVGASVTFIPRPIAEEEIRQIPLIEARARTGLPLGFSVNGRAATNIITTLASLGLQWSASMTHVVVGAGVDETFVYGFATMDGFDVDYRGWITSPFVTLGWSLGDINISLRVETSMVTERTTRVGTVVSANEKNLRAGNAVSVCIEQPFSKDTRVLLGLKVNNLKSAYQSWLAFSTFNDPLLYPEFFVGVKL